MTKDAPTPDAPADDAAQSAARERVRSRRVILVSGVFAILVMSAVVVLGLRAREEQKKRPLAPGMHADYSSGELFGRGGRDPVPQDDCPVDPDNPPRLVFDLPVNGLDFGPVKQGVRLEEDVVFRNEGKGLLCIRRVEAGCGCIKAKLVDDKRKYEPGESGRIRITLDTKGREGTQKKAITVYTNAVDVFLQKFLVRASISLGMRIGPTFLNFGRVTAGQPAEGRVRLRTPQEDSQWEVTSVEGSKPLDGELVKYEWRVENVEDAKDLVREVVVVHPGLTREGPAFQDDLVFKTTHPDRPEFTVRIHLSVVPPIMAVPPRAVLGYVPTLLPPARIRLAAGDATVTFGVTELEFRMPGGSSPPDAGCGFTATQGEAPNGDRWVDIGYDGKQRPPGPLRATLVIHTDLDRMPEVRIECYATVEEPK